MIFNSKLHGKIEYTEEEVYTFKKGILGFPQLTKFLLTDLKEYVPFKLLHSLEDDSIGIITVSPYEFFQEYEIKLSKETVKNLDIESPNDVMIITTVTLNSDPSRVTTNLQGPIVINMKNHFAEQIIIDDQKYKIKQPLMKE